ncbi:MAG: hypothetical protein HYS13_02505 [Planctomycetia bacterium]|nr:hypothetical protein [Planctomycetia bacterium]
MAGAAVRCVLTGGTILVLAILLHASTVLAGDRPSPEALKAAVEKSLRLLQSSAEKYTEQRQCFSCHHQALPAMALAAARKSGFEVNVDEARRRSEFTIAHFQKLKEPLLRGEGVAGGPYSAGYALVGLAADNWDGDETTSTVVAYLKKTQEDDGRWRIRTHRPPLEDNDVTATALALKGLLAYGVPRENAEGEQKADQNDKDCDDLKERMAQAQKWLIEHKPQSTEEAVYRVLGLKWTSADPEKIGAAADELWRLQRDGGGFAQLPDMQPDAYATGQALAALQDAGQVADDDRTAKALKFLLETQLPDGSWLVETRSKPIQRYFESGFPHEKSQFISICATSWATIAISRSLHVASSAAETNGP